MDQEAKLPKGEQGRKRWKWQRVLVIVLVTLFAGVVVIGTAEIVALSQRLFDLQKLIQASSVTGNAGNIDPFQIPSRPVNPDAKELSAFLSDCEKDVNSWKTGQVDYPKKLFLDKNQTGDYSITVDIREEPLPAERMISDVNPQGAPIAVKCILAARLTSIDNSLVVYDASWVIREFTPTGYVNFSWATMGLVSGSHALRLELRPAVTTQISPDGITALLAAAGDSSPDTTTFISRVDVHGSIIDDFNQKFNDYWPIILTIAVAIGGGVLALVRWLRILGRSLHKLLPDWRGKQGKGEQASK